MLLTELQKYNGSEPVAEMFKDLSDEAIQILLEETNKQRLMIILESVTEKHTDLKKLIIKEINSR